MDNFEMLKETQESLKKLKPRNKNLKKSTFRNSLKNLKVKKPAEIRAWEKKNKAAVVPAAAQPVQLDLFINCDDDNIAAMPNTIARSALFAPIARGRRRYLEEILVASRKDVAIRYTGVQLDMGDADVFLQAIRLATEYNLGTEFQILPYGFLKELGRKGTGRVNKEWLMRSLKRLKHGNVSVKTDRYEIILSLIDEYIYDEKKETYSLKFNPKIIALFKKEQYGLIDWDKRKTICKEIGLTKWLQTYIASNAKGQQRINIEKIKIWCGKENRPIWKFRASLKRALRELERLKIITKIEISKKGIIKYIRL